MCEDNQPLFRHMAQMNELWGRIEFKSHSTNLEDLRQLTPSLFEFRQHLFAALVKVPPELKGKDLNENREVIDGFRRYIVEAIRASYRLEDAVKMVPTNDGDLQKQRQAISREVEHLIKVRTNGHKAYRR